MIAGAPAEPVASLLLYRQRDVRRCRVGILSWIVLGLIAGAIARWVMPGHGPRGILVTMVIGIVGAYLGGLIGTSLGMGSVDGFDLRSLSLSVIGAVALLLGYRALASRDTG